MLRFGNHTLLCDLLMYMGSIIIIMEQNSSLSGFSVFVKCK